MTAARRAVLVAGVLAVLALAGFGVLRAADPPPLSRQEQVEAISGTIRCPTCQGLSIRDSSSVLAAGSRAIVEEQLAQGRSPQEIRQYFVDRYGEWILLSPDRNGAGLLVWVVPLLALPAAGLLALRWVRDRRTAALGAPVAGTDGDGDGEAATALAAYRTGGLDPDSSPAGEALREALLVRLALEDEDDAATGAVRHADARLAAAHRRYLARRTTARATGSRGPVLPRRAVTALAVGVLVLGAGASLALGVRTRGATDLPTGDLPGGVVAAGAQLSDLVAATAERPKDGQAWLALGRAYEELEQYGPAVEAYDQALRYGGGDDAALQRATVLVRAGSPREALPTLQDLATRRPDHPDTVLMLGLAQQATGAPEAAVTLRRFLSLAPDAGAADVVRQLLGES